MIETALLLGAFSSLAATVSLAVGVWLHDFKAIRQQNLFRKHPNAKRYRARPLITVLVQVCDDQQQMLECLNRLLSDTYRKKEIIIIDTLPHRRINRWLDTLPATKRRKIDTYRSPGSLEAATVSAYQTQSRSDLILILRGDQQIDRNFLQRLAWHFNSRPSVDLLTIKTSSPADITSLSDLLEVFYRLLSRLSSKHDSALGVLATPTRYQAGTAYRRTASVHGTTDYVSDISITTPYLSSLILLTRRYFIEQMRRTYQLFFSTNSLSQSKKLWSIMNIAIRLTAVFTPVMLGYFTYLAIGLHQPGVLFMTWLVITALLLIAIWSDEHTNWRGKTTLSALVPATFVIVYIVSIIFALSSLAAALRVATTRKRPVARGADLTA